MIITTDAPVEENKMETFDLDSLLHIAVWGDPVTLTESRSETGYKCLLFYWKEQQLLIGWQPKDQDWQECKFELQNYEGAWNFYQNVDKLSESNE